MSSDEDTSGVMHVNDNSKNNHFDDDSANFQAFQDRSSEQQSSPDNADVGIQYIQFIYQENIKLQQDISDITDQMIEIDNAHIKDRNRWEEEIFELENQIKLYREGDFD